ncbi:hypothetical protein GDO81_021934 [Engystomops pustulosus]|uniref:Uncharacterized protein n=1 Tax=Engystomops pustulosus TaxID=76066 RepID=A0AAV6ZWM4_ENGPU|nr:hypothetical protein GDO81_021934 [Engystomops pustulosus]
MHTAWEERPLGQSALYSRSSLILFSAGPPSSLLKSCSIAWGTSVSSTVSGRFLNSDVVSTALIHGVIHLPVRANNCWVCNDN